MTDDGQTAVAIIVVCFIVLIFLGIWASLIVFGVKAAKKKHRSPQWMWFGIHPMGTLIVFDDVPGTAEGMYAVRPAQPAGSAHLSLLRVQLRPRRATWRPARSLTA